MTKYFTNTFSLINLFKKPSVKSEIVTQMLYGESFSVSKLTQEILALDKSIVDYMRKKFNLLIGESTAEKIKKEIGTAIPTNDENTYIMKGRDIRTGVPKEVTLTEKDTAEAMSPVINQMIQALKDALENTPPELAADLVDMGCVLAGGGAYLKNFDKLISKETGLPVSIAEDPLSCVALGTGKALEQQGIFSTMLTEY